MLSPWNSSKPLLLAVVAVLILIQLLDGNAILQHLEKVHEALNATTKQLERMGQQQRNLERQQKELTEALNAFTQQLAVSGTGFQRKQRQIRMQLLQPPQPVAMGIEARRKLSFACKQRPLE